MRQPVRRVARLLEAAGRRREVEHKLAVGLTEFGVLRALAAAFGKPLPPLALEAEEEEEDVRKQIVMRIVRANQ